MTHINNDSSGHLPTADDGIDRTIGSTYHTVHQTNIEHIFSGLHTVCQYFLTIRELLEYTYVVVEHAMIF